MLICADHLRASTKNSQIYELCLQHPSEILSAIRKSESFQGVLVLENAAAYFLMDISEVHLRCLGNCYKNAGFFYSNRAVIFRESVFA